MEQTKVIKLQPLHSCTASLDGSVRLALLVTLGRAVRAASVSMVGRQVVIREHQFWMQDMLSRLESGPYNGVIMNLY